MADRYSKDDILAIPYLQPERHYESEGIEPHDLPDKPRRKKDRLLDTLDDLDRVYNMADFLPPELARLIKPIADELSKHTQGLIILRLKQNMGETPDEPKNPSGETTVTPPEPWKPPSKPDYKPLPVNPPSPPNTPEPFPHYPYSPGPGGFQPKDYIENWPGSGYQYDEGAFGDNSYEVIGTGDGEKERYEVISTDTEPGTEEEAEVEDIFSEEPVFTVKIGASDSLVNLARKGYMQDDCDIKEHFTSRMTQLTHRFFQVMTAIAEECGLLDYTDLMEDFDGTAVFTDDPDLRHLIDTISKSQVVYDQKIRQMNLLNTAENTLIYQRNMTAAQAQRERYLGEKYKTHMPNVTTSFSNDLLLQSRDEAEKKYQNAAYNMYKYLDSATKFTNTLLNMKIDQASAKAQLINTGSDIFARTPPPQPLPDEVDNNFQTTKDHQGAAQKLIDEQKKDSKKGSEVSSSSGSFSGTVNTNVPQVGVAPGKGAENIPKSAERWTVDMCVRCSKGCGIPADWIWAQFCNESGNFESPCAPYNYGGMTDSGGGWKVFSSPEDFADYMAKILPRWVGSDGKGTTQAKTMLEYCVALQTDTSPYCAEPAGVEPYYAAMLRCLQNQGTVIS